LRTRVEDIPQFAMSFLQSSSERFGKNFESLEPELVKKLQEYDWPGNVRELKNTIDRMVVLYDGPVLRTAWWDPPQKSALFGGLQSVASPGRLHSPNSEPDPFSSHASPNRRQRLAQAKRLLEESGNDLTWVAAQLGIHPTTLYRWRKANKV